MLVYKNDHLVILGLMSVNLLKIYTHEAKVSHLSQLD